MQPGNQSPIGITPFSCLIPELIKGFPLCFSVLQRFYHQQNQLREKEAAERYQQQRQQPPAVIGVTSTNPFHSNYVAPPPSTHSTSSQSSTQSTCSQIAVNSTSLSPSAGVGAASAAGHFGCGGNSEPLQYQPLPIAAETTAAVVSPRSPEQQQQPLTTDYSGPGSTMVASKLSKLYARRQLLGQSSSSGASSSSLDGYSREQNDAGEPFLIPIIIIFSDCLFCSL